MSLALTSRIDILRDRAEMLKKARAFFAERDVLEVDVPILSRLASVDLHIDLVQASCMKSRVFLHSSPEYGMKRLLAEGVGNIYQLSHVFREGEQGDWHNPEFTMAEWYRMGFSLEEMIEETVAFCRLFVDSSHACEKISYQEAFSRYVGFFPESLEERDRLFVIEIESHLGRKGPTIIYDFPAAAAALSQIGKNGMAERFEVYIEGVELANGYHELLDPIEQRKRFEKANLLRQQHKKEMYPIDEHLIEALEKKIPDCCGVAVGFDRLMMLRHGSQKIDEILPFAWNES